MDKLSRFFKTSKKQTLQVIGLMSGMSMDGVDLAHVEFSGEFPKIKHKILGTHEKPYSIDMQSKIKQIKQGGCCEIAAADFYLGEIFSEVVNEYLETHSIPPDQIDAIGSHGQAVYHSIEKPVKTLQLGSISLIAERTGILTTGNFRTRDIAAGGVGAPFAPLLDQLLFADSKQTTCAINLGSISNISVLEPGNTCLAFDMGPANLWIDYIMELITGRPGSIDESGSVSKNGKVIEAVLRDWLSIPYTSLPLPKAAGYDDFNFQHVDKWTTKHDLIDLLRTAIEFSGKCIADSIDEVQKSKKVKIKKAFISGGGVYNDTFMDAIRRLVPEVQVINYAESNSPQINNSKEALLFALLGYQTVKGFSSSELLATGSKPGVVLGEIAL